MSSRFLYLGAGVVVEAVATRPTGSASFGNLNAPNAVPALAPMHSSRRADLQILMELIYDLRFVSQTLLMAVFLHAFAAFVLGDLRFSSLFE